MPEMTWLDATAQADLVRRGEVSPKELAEAAIARIEAVNPQLDAVIRTRFDEARLEADEDLPDGAFRGVPILFKDLGCTVAGEPTAFGVGPMREVAWPVTSHLAEQFRAAGFVALGRTNVPELGTTVTTEPRSFPPARNPWDPGHSTGGSSGGSAAAVASGMVPVAHANDGGGSIRIPASCCGLFGLKPTRARNSLGPHLGDINGGLVCEHVVARSVRDSAAILDLLCGPRPGDPYAALPPARPYAQEVGADPGRLKIAYATRHPDVERGEMIDSHPDCVAAVEDAAALLRQLGHEVVPARIDALDDPELIVHFLSLWAVGVTAEVDDVARMLGRAVRPDDVEPVTYALAELGRLISASAYLAAWR